MKHLPLFFVLFLAATLLSGLGFAARAEGGADARWLEAGEMAEADLGGGEAAFAFTAPSGSVYEAWLFPADEALPSVHASLYRGNRLVAGGDGLMPALSARLTAGAEYVLRLRGEGRVRVEIARHALSRCYDSPMDIDARGDAYSKAFVRAGDAHWYAVEAGDSARLALVGVPAEDSVRLTAMLFDDAGRLLAEAMRTGGGACLLDFRPEPGKRCRVRLRAEDGATGLYELRLIRLPGNGTADRVALSAPSLILEGRDTARLTARVSPVGAGGVVYWESSNPAVARVDDAGTVTGQGVGTATVTAYGAGGASDRCLVRVHYVPVSGVSLLSRRIALSVGDDAAIECDVLPGNASDPKLSYSASPEGVVSVDRGGVLRALREGTATVTVRALDGGLSDALTVDVGPAPRRWRALLVGEQNYASTVASVRTGSVHSVAALRSMLQNLSFGGAKVQIDTRLDVTRDGVLAAVRDAFSEAGDGDVNLFYITCHGYYAGGMTCFQMYDGSVLTAAELAAALRAVKGENIVLIDCCGSGGVIGVSSGTADVLKGIDAVFSGVVGPAAMDTSRFRVLASAALEQDSYRLSFSREAAEPDMATVFARAVCEAGGWSLERSARAAMRADADYDGRVTLNELYVYAARRVMWYLRLTAQLTGAEADYVQTVQVWPEGDGTVVFGRE